MRSASALRFSNECSFLNAERILNAADDSGVNAARVEGTCGLDAQYLKLVTSDSP